MMGRNGRAPRLVRAPLADVVAAAAAIALVAGALFGAWTPACAQALPKPSEIVKIDGLKLAAPLKAGRTSKLLVDAEILSGWHINSDHPSSPDFIPTRLTVTAPGGLKAGEVKYPRADEIAPAFSGGDKLSVFTGPIEFEVPLSARASFKPSGAIAVTLDYQPCNDNICLPPAQVRASAPLASLKPSADAGASWHAAAGAVSAAAAAAYEARAPRLTLAAFDTPSESTADAAGGAGGEGWKLADIFARHGMLLGLLAVLLGGLALNLTPCVYPLIGVTLAYFANQGGGPRRIAMLAVIYVLGIALTFSAAGVAVALSGGLFGAALQNPWVLALIAAALLALAGSSFGLYSLQPPQWMMQRAGAARPGYVGALAMGLGMGVVAAPCIGPIVLGLLLMVERSADPVFGFTLFFTLAIGLGLPYVALALAAGHIRALPRSGEWLAWIEQLFGFVLVGLGLYFLDPLLHGWPMRLMPYYAAAAGIFLGFVTQAGRAWRPFLVFRSALGALALGALAYLLLFPAPRPPAQLSFDPYDAKTVAQARADRKPVLIDFSASWCIPCREMQRTTFRDPAVIREAAHFIRLEADLTQRNPRNKQLSGLFGIRGVPTTLFIDKHGRILKREVGYVDARQFLSDLREIDEIDGLPEVRNTPATQAASL